MTGPVEERYLEDELCDKLGVKPPTLARYRRLGLISTKVGRSRCYDWKTVEAFLREHGFQLHALKSHPDDPAEVEEDCLTDSSPRHRFKLPPGRPNADPTKRVCQCGKPADHEVHQGFMSQDEMKQAKELATVRKAKALAEKYELQLEIMAGNLVDKTKVQQDQIERVVIVRARLLGMVGKLAPRLAHRTAEEVQDELEAEVRDILTEFSRKEAA